MNLNYSDNFDSLVIKETTILRSSRELDIKITTINEIYKFGLLKIEGLKTI